MKKDRDSLMNERLLIGLLHLDVKYGSPEKNRASLLSCAEKAAASGAGIIMAPELALSGYSFNSMDEIAPYTEELTGETITALSQLAYRFGVYVGTGIAERDGNTGIFYNSSVVLGPDGKMAALHRKHVAERRWSRPGGPSRTSLFETPWGKVGLLICADTYYGLLPRSHALHGADLLVVSANWPPSGIDPREVWRARSLENGIGLVAVNRTGLDRRMDCSAAPSYAIAPDGTVLLDETSADSRVFFVEYCLDKHRFPSDFRKQMEAARRPWDYNAIALETADLDEFPDILDLPDAGSIDIKCLVPFSESSHREEVVGALTAMNDKGGLLVLPHAMMNLSLEELARQSEQHSVVIAAGMHSPAGLPIPALVAGGNVECLPPDADSIMADFGVARVALVRSRALRHPETAVALSKRGCDIIVTQADDLDDDLRLILGIKSLERSVVAVAGHNGATICVPPDGHERWRETVRMTPGFCAATVNTTKTRKKRFLDRVDMEVLLRR